MILLIGNLDMRTEAYIPGKATLIASKLKNEPDYIIGKEDAKILSYSMLIGQL